MCAHILSKTKSLMLARLLFQSIAVLQSLSSFNGCANTCQVLFIEGLVDTLSPLWMLSFPCINDLWSTCLFHPHNTLPAIVACTPFHGCMLFISVAQTLFVDTSSFDTVLSHSLVHTLQSTRFFGPHNALVHATLLLPSWPTHSLSPLPWMHVTLHWRRPHTLHQRPPFLGSPQHRPSHLSSSSDDMFLTMHAICWS